MFQLLVIIVVAMCFINIQSYEVIHMSEVVPDRMIRLPCIDPTMLGDATISSECRCEYCGRRVMDGAFNDSDVSKLHEIVTKAMSHRVVQNNGPTILDINTGYLRDTDGLDNLFYKEMKKNAIYSVDDFAHYGNIIRKLKDLVMDSFSVSEMYFTSPTFITRLRALDSNWEPKEIHDEYWHPHVDHNNTGHYHYSGLLYMSNYGLDFTGGDDAYGRIKFLRPDKEYTVLSAKGKVSSLVTDEDVELAIEPRAGRVVIFTAGMENTHYVERVLSGQRFVLSFWFTCNRNREFPIFLDGKAHTAFSQKIRDSIISSSGSKVDRGSRSDSEKTSRTEL